MRLTFWGAARQVTGSMHLVEANGARVLLDCGLMQGHRAEAKARNAQLPFESNHIHAVLVSHAHLDHCGNLPTLVKSGFTRDIVGTHATNDLTRIMLLDAAKIQEQDAAYWNKKRVPRGEEPIAPLYTRADADAAIRSLTGRAYEKWFDVPGARLRAQFLDAGHILGSAITVLEAQENGQTLRLGFSGDLGVKGKLILRDPAPVPPLDYLIIEGTYGDRLHALPRDSESELAQLIEETAERDGKTIIPAFALDRTQEVVYSIHRSISNGMLAPLPVFADSPLAMDATEIYRMHPEVFDHETVAFMEKYEDPFGFRQLTYTRDVEASKAINLVEGAAVIISANGMVEAGRILHHVKNNIEDPRNTILFVGYQAENTLGRRILDGIKRVRIFGEEYTVRARIERVDGFSAHADRKGLLDWVRPIASQLKGVFVVHAEERAADALVQGLRELGIENASAPAHGQQVTLN
ncbi:MAG: MBL fold metallo-hydrolase [Chloroflexi bacterium]|nr:MBL fold metallo-hydrolase [Chloroflexota bacterium]